MLFYLVSEQTTSSTHVMSVCTLKKYFMLKNLFFFKFKVLNVIKTHFDYFNSQKNNLNAMERKGTTFFFIEIKQYFGKI